MERRCTKTCTTECVMTGDRSKLQLCTSCCQDNMCNYGNGAKSLMSCGSKTLEIIILTLSIIGLPEIFELS